MSQSGKIVTVVLFKPTHGVETQVFHDPESALEYFEQLSDSVYEDHAIQVWDTGYKIREGIGRVRRQAALPQDANSS